tara:strand:- start:1 stop:1107 length:1107 start_codon:yes stop_codon:yes gene_type:complete
MSLIKVKSRGTDNVSVVSSRRNLVINGDMQIAQRQSSSTAQGYVVCDRWKNNKAGPDVTTTWHSLSTTDTPYSLGFRKSYQLHVTDPQSPDAAADYAELEYRIEAQDMATSGWNYNSADSKITLSFWVLSTVAGTYSMYIRSLDTSTSSNCAYSFNYTVSANTWKKVEHTLPGHANLVFDNNNDAGLVMYFTLYYGTNYTGTVTNEEWRAHNGSAQVGNYAQNILATDESKFEITGVQLEVGANASDFDHRSMAQELSLCQRYCIVTNNWHGGEYPGQATTNGMIGSTTDAQNNYAALPIQFPTRMRATPNLTAYDDAGADAVHYSGNGRAYSLSPFGAAGGRLYINNISAGSEGARIAFNYKAEAEL